jgi:hypothetical protein
MVLPNSPAKEQYIVLVVRELVKTGVVLKNHPSIWPFGYIFCICVNLRKPRLQFGGFIERSGRLTLGLCLFSADSASWRETSGAGSAD